MIIDVLENAKNYYGLGERIERALKFLEESDLETLECGIYYIDDENVYASVQQYETKSKEEKRWEAHKNYIDIQYIVKGEEVMGYTNVGNLTTTIEYSADKDVLFGTAQGGFLEAKEGTFMMFMSQDAHMPGVTLNETTTVKKVVMKILV